jgi:hypothetical protein
MTHLSKLYNLAEIHVILLNDEVPDEVLEKLWAGHYAPSVGLTDAT